MKGEVENLYHLRKGLDCFKQKNDNENPEKIYLIISNSEIFNGIVEDKVTPMIKDRIKNFNAEISWNILLPYDDELIDFEIRNAVNKDAEVIIITRGADFDNSDIVTLTKYIS